MSPMRADWVEYVAALLRTDEGSVAHEIGRRVWELSTNEAIFDYLTATMAENAPSARAFEIAWDIWALMSGQVTR